MSVDTIVEATYLCIPNKKLNSGSVSRPFAVRIRLTNERAVSSERLKGTGETYGDVDLPDKTKAQLQMSLLPTGIFGCINEGDVFLNYPDIFSTHTPLWQKSHPQRFSS